LEDENARTLFPLSEKKAWFCMTQVSVEILGGSFVSCITLAWMATVSQPLLEQAECMQASLFGCLHADASYKEMMFGFLYKCSLHEIKVEI
jgi:hypothetical protein